MALEVNVLAWDSYKIVAVLSRLIGSKHFSSDNWISNDKTDINKQIQFYATKNTHYHKNE
jgi:hypothetical protein